MTELGNHGAAGITAADEVEEICRTLIRFDTSNFGGNDARPERPAAEYVAELMTGGGLAPKIYESSPGRASVVARMEGTDPSLPALVVHGHLDVVPAQAEDWSVDPFAAEVKDGLIWGRGAVDMKDMDAMILAVQRQMHREGVKPQRDLIFAYFADEEAGGTYGAGWMVENHPEVFAGAGEAISEVGGFSSTVGGRRAYFLQTAEKGLHWLTMHAGGRAGHGSQINDENAVTRLAGAISRIGAHEWPIEYTKTTRALMEGVSELTGIEFDERNPEPLLDALGNVSRFVGATLQNTSNPTALKSGYKHNVIPGAAEAFLDCRTLPGRDELLHETLRELAGAGVDFSTEHSDTSLEVPFSGSLVDNMVASISAEDPGAVVLPYMLSGGTDNKSLSRLGITGYGFAPLQLPDELDFTSMFHGVDERVPVDALKFGTRVLSRLLRTY
ncbi:MAG: M20/M25/M40 family metallo-hydrolase [Arthrobacter sp.]|uniref:M20/M25/M40 family metallo-hydrolase n=1 Tax=Arthrobacter sp. 179 TaxID=3457734 RepID=UPI00264D16C7|nr:M20/M25/M40 family metallo-hydrolase [Micrococcaceae bacterium]MDN5814028.1 M20/M25/M40 family metallo-hydrolase [Micrococcaceae bacterium]MDN5824689.1 M20/M25/M40 family metallo-hydrolase [Micrococcaceae bacterium]MDN5878245.1 M20/M25/M40 family metallo-hydrolase [Micrococcaceae bacterium]MDN5885761.1 M20/M25/M40 family metallo-hydrolase [Micrococcaceae bacterium]